FNGKDFLVVWQDSRLESSQYDLFGARVSPAGVVLDTNGIEFVNSEYSRANVELISATPDPDTGAQVLLVFDGFVGDPHNSNRALGAIYYPPTGIEEGYTQEISTGYRINISPTISHQEPFAVSYSLMKKTPIKISVYDIAGRLVKNIKNDNIKGIGKIEFTLDGMSQGIYFVRVEAEKKTEATKIVWLK
ncbi:MAG: T9SS type A sorting domain-containing protein, partial [bacterium]